MLISYLSILSEATHFLAFSCKKPLTKFDKGVLVFSVDVDVGSQPLGKKNRGMNDRNVHNSLPESAIGRIEELAVPLLLQTCNDMQTPMTFAVRGQLTEVDSPIISMIMDSPTKHDIGAHGYYHKAFTVLSKREAEEELEMISKGMKQYGVVPRSFIFPRNRIAHLDLLEKWKYLCFRGCGNIVRDGMYIRKYNRLYDIHPGLYLGNSNDSYFPKRILDIAVRYKALLHVWFHPWNLGNSDRVIRRRIAKVLIPFLKHANEKQDRGILRFETMCSLAEQQAKTDMSRESFRESRQKQTRVLDRE